MAGERVKLVVSQRTKLGSAETRRLRRQGFIPGVLYGRSEPVAISVAERELRTALTTAGGTHAVLDVAVDGGSEHSAILKEFQRDNIRGYITHVDLQEVRLDQPIHATVAITVVGEAPGVKEGGVLTQVTNDVHVEGLPLEIPQHVEVDVSGLGIGDAVRLSDVTMPAGITLLDDLETVIATVAMQTRLEEPETVAEGEEAAEGEGETPAAEGAESGDGAEAAAAEPGE